MRAHIFSGGGAGGAQLLKKYVQTNLPYPDLFGGTSAGGLIAMSMAHFGIKGTLEQFRGIKSRRHLFADDISSRGLWDPWPLQKRLANIVSYPKKVPYYVCSYDLEKMQSTYFTHRDGWYLLSSTACIPGLVQPIADVFVDGGVVRNTPLTRAIKLGATEIDVFHCFAKEESLPEKPKNVVDILLRSIEAGRIEVAELDKKLCEAYNKIPGKKKISVRYHYPDYNELGMLDFHLMGKVLASI